MVSTQRASSPRFAAVSSTVALVTKAPAPHCDRKPPLILRCTTDLRNARSGPGPCGYHRRGLVERRDWLPRLGLAIPLCPSYRGS